MEYIVRVVMGSLWGILWRTSGNWWEGILGYVVFHVRIGSPMLNVGGAWICARLPFFFFVLIYFCLMSSYA